MEDKDRESIIDMAIELNNLLDLYVSLHDNFIGKGGIFSFRYIIPIPFIFKKIDYKKLYFYSENILSEMDILVNDIENIEQSLINETCEFLIILKEYAIRLRTTISKLSTILSKLYRKSQKELEYNFSAYDHDLDDYNKSILNYSKFGDVMNQKFNEFNSQI